MNRQLTQAPSVSPSDARRGRLRINDGSAVTLGRRGGTLTVVHGEVWLTRDGDPVDHRLVPGQRVMLHADERAVVGAWHRGQDLVVCWQPDRGALALLALGLVPLRSTAMAAAAAVEHAAAALAHVAHRTRKTLGPASIE